MAPQESSNIRTRMFEDFDEATPLAFGYGDDAAVRDWFIAASDGAEFNVWLAAWTLLMSRFSGDSLISVGVQQSDDRIPRPLMLEVQEEQSSERYLESIAAQFKVQTLSEQELRKAMGFDPERTLFHCVVFHSAAEGMGVRGRYSVSDATLRKVSEHLHRVVAALAIPNRSVRTIEHLSEAERIQVIKAWNPDPTEYPESTVQTLFEKQVAERPDAVALVYGNEHVTYSELNNRSNRMAHYLVNVGVRPGQGVATFLERGVPQLVSTLAVLKAGAAYIPLDVEFPPERIGQMLEDAKPPVVLTQAAVADRLADVAGANLISLDDITKELESCSGENPGIECGTDDLAYIMYTSGSTGRPKGVEVVHRGIIRLVFGTDYVPFGTDTVMLHMAAVSFDASTLEIWGPLLHGGKCVLSPSRVPTLETIGQLLEEHQVNIFWMTAALFNLAITAAPEILKPVKYLLAGGEALSPWHVEKALKELPETQLINGYGPTENTTFSTTYTFERALFDPNKPIPIGRAISNSTCYILDRFLRPVAPGVPGELYVGGAGVARGYAGRPDLTADRFLADPFSDQPNARMYKTGDMVYWNRDGMIEFIGRVDNQIKLRGFRIELQDIDLALGAFPSVEQAVTMVYEDEGRGKWLAGFVKVANPEHFPVDELKSFAYGKLPDYMVPAVFVPVAEWSYTPSGKLDRKALTKPTLSISADDRFTAPESETQKWLAALWQRLLKLKRVGIDDDFFELGGDSLGSVYLFHEIAQRTGREFPLALLNQHSTVRELAAAIDDEGGEVELAGFRCLQVIQKGDSKVAPLFMIHGGAGNVLVFREFARNLGSRQPVYAFQWSGWDGSRGHESIAAMASAYKAELLRFEQREAYRIGGHCIGGLIAIELARQLQADGIEVDGPVLVVDCPNLEASSYHKEEPDGSATVRRQFQAMMNDLEERHERWGSWTSPELDEPSGAKSLLKRSPLVVSAVHWMRHQPSLIALQLNLVRGRKVPVDKRPFYSSQTLVNAAKKHKSHRHTGDIVYFRSCCVLGRNLGLQGWWNDPFMGFEELCAGRFEGYVAGGGHNDVLSIPEVASKVAGVYDG